ncbi:uncharacterized protein EV422DRAFT_570775 [Fimicolochytrium jonesii]|uniref:uncharacterized protein n=1 Tax=Fimicolochytrium jonesii TaxID=1396493 RepID=UPI0022FEFC42|nr:uncharacterized protein EV422DRAFT_570775 [Fimicolochytrium jonesii]KAI8817428.1 hypothetical protein EV422DRAFT_570775 [Fimicolochytrium jonesii]
MLAATPNNGKKTRTDAPSGFGNNYSPNRPELPGLMHNQLANLGMRVRKSINDGYKTTTNKPIFGCPTNTTDVSPQKTIDIQLQQQQQHQQQQTQFNTQQSYQQMQPQQAQQQQYQQQAPNPRKRQLTMTDYYSSNQQ